MTFTRENLENLIANSGAFLPGDVGYKECADLDGLTAHLFLQSLGYTVLGHRDRGSHGAAYTACGVILSTNGFVSRDVDRAWEIHLKA